MKFLNNKKTLIPLIGISLLIQIGVNLLLPIFIWFHMPIYNQNYSNGMNGLWLRHQWVGEQKTKEEYKELALNLKKRQISDAFFHSGPLNEFGEVEEEKYKYVKDLLENLREYYPELHIQAWLGQIEKRDNGPLDLSNEEIRNKVVKTSEKFLDLGFDGIHYDIEPVPDGSRTFIDLIKKTKEVTKQRGKILSVAADELEPFIGVSTLAKAIVKNASLWSKEYFVEVAEIVDQIQLMMYDTTMQTDWLYGKVVAFETETLANLISERTKLFIGVPTYEDETFGFHPNAENMKSGIRGIQKGLENIDKNKRKNIGIAIYSEWVTDDKEWEIYEREWLR